MSGGQPQVLEVQLANHGVDNGPTDGYLEV